MVGINEDRNVLQFIWVDNINSSTPKIVSFCFTQVVFGVTASPFLLNATISHHLNKYKESDPGFVEKFSRSMYVDGVISGAENPEDPYKLYENSRSRHMQGGFKLRKFTSNSSELPSRVRFEEINETTPITTCLDTIPDDVSYVKSMFENERSDSNQEQRILGVLWTLTLTRF